MALPIVELDDAFLLAVAEVESPSCWLLQAIGSGHMNTSDEERSQFCPLETN